MEYQKRPGYVRAFILIFLAAVLILISTTISGSDLPAYTKICPPNNPLCTNLTNLLRPVENLWNSFITHLRQLQPSTAEFAENYVYLVVIIAGLVILLIGVFGLLTAIFRSIRQFKSKDRSVYAKRERKLRKFFDQEPIRFGSGIPWLVLTVVFIAIVYWLNRYYPISDQICKQTNWLCQKNEYTSLLDMYLPLIFLVVCGLTGLRAAFKLIPSLIIRATTPSSRKVKNWLDESATRLAQESLDSLHLVGSQRRPKAEIILLPVPPFDEFDFEDPPQIAVEDRDIKMKIGRIWGREVAFYGAYYVTILQFDENRFAIYECVYSFIQDFAYNAHIYESQYDNIVAVSMKQLSVSIPGTGARQKWAEVLGLSFASGEVASIYIPNTESLRKAKSNDLPYTNAERVINVLRTKLGSRLKN